MGGQLFTRRQFILGEVANEFNRAAHGYQHTWYAHEHQVDEQVPVEHLKPPSGFDVICGIDVPQLAAGCFIPP